MTTTFYELRHALLQSGFESAVGCEVCECFSSYEFLISVLVVGFMLQTTETFVLGYLVSLLVFSVF